MLLLQTLIGAWPNGAEVPTGLRDRLQQYMFKAAKEAKVNTSWIQEDQRWEDALRAFIDGIFELPARHALWRGLAPFARKVAEIGMHNSLAQLTLKIAAPGVPDFYQGTEMWDFSLVDPDNRRPVDFAARASALASLEAPDWTQLVRDWPDGRLKLAWTRHLLKLRAELADVFAHGDYQPLEVSGPQRDHIIAFARRHGRDAVIVAASKSFAPFTDGGRIWPPAKAFSGTLNIRGYTTKGDADELQLETLFRSLPVAVLQATFAGASKPARKRARA
jgi:(1->4)-alpha-D-glucan 1-alpha-D-glucosylmutase